MNFLFGYIYTEKTLSIEICVELSSNEAFFSSKYIPIEIMTIL